MLMNESPPLQDTSRANMSADKSASVFDRRDIMKDPCILPLSACPKVKTNPVPAHSWTSLPRNKTFQRLFLLISALCCAYIGYTQLSGSHYGIDVARVPQRPAPGVEPARQALGPLPPNEHSDLCPQPKALHPRKHRALQEELERVYADETYRLKVYKALGGAIQIPTESYDDLGPVGEDSRWEPFGRLHEYLEQTFPRVFESLNVTRVNTYGIVLHWQGSDKSALPVLMAAHQDVVPIEPATKDEWIHPPYSGFYDGEWIWGRGSCDDKSNLIAGLQAIDALLEQGFKPRRTFVWAYGFDEEASGKQGAGSIAPYLEETYGPDGIALILDEGGGSYGTQYGGDVIFAVPSLSEKGYLDVRIEISAQGGHSSVPPKHTAIGMLSSIIVAIESQPHEASLVRGGGAYNATQCAAVYAPEYPEKLRRLALEAVDSDSALEKLRDGLMEEYPRWEAVLRTTQAVDLVEGGVKVNALPEKVSAVVNHRIAEHSSVAELKQHFTTVTIPVATRLNLSLQAFGHDVSAGSGKGGHVVLSDAFGTGLEPSPVTPMGEHDPSQVFAGTLKATIETAEDYNASGVIVAPLLQLGNTDTRYYWNLTRNIVRYKHLGDLDRFNGAHTVNEAVRATGWIQSIRFFTNFILNCDEHL
ncbi:carboxypeptidase S [Trametes punicea]|nr:carboxypeptidase S [Trametes punicea]